MRKLVYIRIFATSLDVAAKLDEPFALANMFGLGTLLCLCSYADGIKVECLTSVEKV